MDNKKTQILLLLAFVSIVILIMVGFYIQNQNSTPVIEPSNPGYNTAQPSNKPNPTPSDTPTVSPSPTPDETPSESLYGLLDPLAEQGEPVSAALNEEVLTQFENLLYDYLLINSNETLTQRNLRLQGKIAEGSQLWLSHPTFGTLSESAYNDQGGAAGYAKINLTRIQGGWLDDYRIMVGYKYTYVYPGGEDLAQDVVLTTNNLNDISFAYNTETKKWELNKLGPAY